MGDYVAVLFLTIDGTGYARIVHRGDYDDCLQYLRDNAAEHYARQESDYLALMTYEGFMDTADDTDA